jgi:PERQ amino acid-rich with GYF domain-containing protein
MSEWSSTFGNFFVSGGDGVNSVNYLAEQKRLLERENPLQIEGDIISVAQKQKKDSSQSTSHSTLFHQVIDPSSEALQPQNVNLLSMLLPAGKHQAPTANSGLPLWSDTPESEHQHPVVCGIDPVHDLHNSQQIGIDSQQRYSVTQNQPTLACLNPQIMQPEQFFSEMSQDPQLNISQQQYLPSELQLQPLMPVIPQPQSSLLNNIPHLRQQEHHQQQQHISQVLPHDCSSQQLYDPYGTNHVSLSSGDCLKLCLQRTQEILELAQKLPSHGMHEIQLPGQVVGFSESWGPVLPLPHEMMGHAPLKECSASFTQYFAVSDAPSGKESTVDSLSKKTPNSGAIEGSKVTVYEDKGFTGSYQDLAKLGNVSSHISNQVHDVEISSTHPQSWKSPPCARTKSLLEIQAEEQLEAQREMATENAKVTTTVPLALSIPWASLAESSEQQFGDETKSMGCRENVNISGTKRSQLHDLLAEEVLVRSSDKDAVILDSADDTSFPPLAPYVTQCDAHYLDDGDFIEVKDARKKMNKADKSKGSAVKAPAPLGSFNPSVISVPIEKGKPVKQDQQEKEELPPQPSAPSLGDFVPWKNDEENTAPGPVWSTDTLQVCKPLSLRDIQMEERESGSLQQIVPASSHAKEPMNQQSHGNDSSYTNSNEDLFWGSSEHAKQDKYVFSYLITFSAFLHCY